MSSTRAVPLTCHGHSRPITYLNFSPIVEDGKFYLLSACKDNNPILRDGQTGDWIGTFLGHKGAVWSARLSHDAKLAATGSADYTAKVWNAATGEIMAELQHQHIVKSVCLVPPGADSSALGDSGGVGGEGGAALLTGGADKKLRLWRFSTTDTARGSGTTSPTPTMQPKTISTSPSQQQLQPSQTELAPNTHKGTIKSIVFTHDNPNIFITASDETSPNSGKIRWFDLRKPNQVLAEFSIQGSIGSCEMNLRPSPNPNTTNGTTSTNNMNGTHSPSLTNGATPASSSTSISNDQANTPPALRHETSILSIASGTNIYFLSGSSSRPAHLIRQISNLPRDVSTVALDLLEGRFVCGGRNDTYVYVCAWDDVTSSAGGNGNDGGARPNGINGASGGAATGEQARPNGLKEIEHHKGHHGPVWCTAFSPDGRLFATGSEDGTVKLWKWGVGGYGLWRGE